MTLIPSLLTDLKLKSPVKVNSVRLKAAVMVSLMACAMALPRAAYARMGSPGRASFDFSPGPYLLSPATDNIDLAGKEYLEFKWERNALVRTGYFDFRLYKGYETTAGNLILKKQVAPAEYPVRVPASAFEAGQTYTWVLVQVFDSGQKSDRSFSSFKIIKK